MGGGGKGGSSTQTVTIPPEVLARYNAVNARAEGVAQTPFKKYSDDPNAFVAGLTPTQQAGIANTNAAAGTAQPYYQTATQGLLGAQNQAAGAINQAYGDVGAAQNVGNAYGNAATNSYNQATGASQPYYQGATQNIANSQNIGNAYGNAATNYTVAGGQAVNAGDLQTDRYFDPFARTVAGTTYAALQQQQGQDRARLAGQQAASGAFGNDRTGLERANLARQQTLGTAQAITPIMSQAYQNAQQTAQQQQGVGLGAAQANRAALAGAGQQLAALGQQQYGQGMTAAQQQAAIAQQKFGQQMQLGQGYGNLGQQQFGQGMTAAQQRAALGNQAFGMGATSAQQLAALGTGAQAAGLQGAQAQLAAGQIQQQTEQAGKAAKYNQFLQEQGYPFQVAQFLANIAEGTGALSGSTTSTSQASDERLKENIKKIGETNDGQPIYKYNFKGSPTTQIGLLAQNVEKKHPDAVGKAPEGYKTVDYDKATESSEGGGVHPSNARQGFALGGSDAFDPIMVKDLLRRQVEMYQQQGTPGGGKSPGAAGYMPAPQQLPANLSIARPAAPPPKQPSGFAEAAQTGRTISEGLGMAEGAKTKLFGGTDAKGKPVAGWLDRSDEANALRDAQDAAKKKILEATLKGEARGGLITGPRIGYAAGGLPYGEEDAVKKGYMGQISYDTPTPIQLKNQQDAMRSGKLADSPQSGLGEAAGAASKLYSTGKMASAAYDKAASMLSGATPAGELATKYPIAPTGTPTPPVRPEGLGGTSPNPLADMPSANATPVSHTAAANTAEGFHIPMGATPAAEAAPVTEGLGAAAAPVAETAAAAAPVAEGLAAAAPVAEGLAAAAPVAEAGASALEFLPLLFLKNGGMAGREHHDGSEGNVVGESATPEFDRLKRERLEAEAAAAAEAPAPEKRTLGAYKKASEVAAGDDVYAQLHPEFGPKFRQFIEEANRQGIPIKPGSLYRTPQEQAGLVADKAANRRGQYQGLPVANPYESPHNYAMAGDFAGYKPEYRGKLGEIAKGIPGMVYGGDFNDPIHVQLGRNHGQLKNLAYDENGKFNREFKLPEGFLSGDQATAYMPQEGLPSVVRDAFKGVKDLPDTVKSGLGSAKQTLSDAGDYYTSNREHIIPILSGLGTLLASSKPTHGQAIGEGLVGYAASAGDMMKRAADVKSTEQTTEATRAETANKAFLVDPTTGVARVRYIKPDGTYGYMYESEYRALPPEQRDAVKIDPDARKQMEEHIASKGAKTPASTGLVPPPTGTTTTAGTGTGLVPSGTAKPSATPFDVSDEDRSAAIKEAQKYATNPNSAKANVTDVFAPQQKIAEGARQQERLLHEFGAGLSALPREKSLLVTGSTSEGAIKIAKALNTVVPMVGGQAVVNPADVTTAENVRKTLEQLKKNAQDSGNLKALGIYQALEESLPSSTQTFGGAAKNFSQAAVNTRREIDKDNYFNQWRNAAAGPTGKEYVEVANRTGTGLDERFNKKTAAQYEKEMAALQKMYTEYVPGTKSDSGRPMTYYQFLVKHAAELSPEEQQVVAKKFGAPHILRYFPSSGQ
jgi:hypothetical protein